MRKIAALLGVLIPTIAFVALRLQPAWDITVSVPLFHFYIVTFATFTAVVVTMLLGLNMNRASPSRHRLLMTAFSAMGAFFLMHGLFTPNAITSVFNPGLQWGAWLTLSSGGVLFSAAAFDRPDRPLAWRQLRYINVVVLAFYSLFAGLVFFAPEVLAAIDEAADPLHAFIVFWATLISWVFASVRFTQIWRQTGHIVDGTMGLIAFWFFLATISMHRFPLWQLSWWLYHFLLLAGTITASYTLVRSYEQLRHFRLTRYYAAIGLILTAAASLTAAYWLARAVEYQFIPAADGAAAVIRARQFGLLVTGVAMMTLFGALFLVVRRADALLTARSDELARAYTDLQAAEALRDDMTSMIVHDLRTPLTGIKLSVDLLARAEAQPAKAYLREDMIKRTRDAADRMLTLVNEILDVSKLEAGQFELDRHPVVLADLIAERIGSFAVQAERVPLRLTSDAAPDLPLIPADRNVLARVFDNLIGNALKHTEAGGHIEIEARCRDERAVIRVKDTGGGIPVGDLTRIFEKFGQVTDASGRPVRAGTGLGLPYCKLAVEAHGGQIWVESELGVGSVFSVSLPTTN